MAEDFVMVRWHGEVMARDGLPDIEYPVPVAFIQAFDPRATRLGVDDLLLWRQCYTEQATVDSSAFAPAMRRLAELLALGINGEPDAIEGDRWYVRLGPVDLDTRIVTVQRQHRLIAASMNGLVFPLTTSLFMPEWMPKPVEKGFTDGSVALFDRLMGSFAAREGSLSMPYALPSVRVELAEWNPGVPISIWRSVGHSYTCFVIESFINELAAAAGEDPAAFRQRHLKDSPRHLAALELVLEKSRSCRRSARFAIWRMKIDSEKCNNCGICERNCLMDIKLLEYKNAGQRILSTECVFCQTCLKTCPKSAVVQSFGQFDITRQEHLRYRGEGFTRPAPKPSVVSD